MLGREVKAALGVALAVAVARTPPCQPLNFTKCHCPLQDKGTGTNSLEQAVPGESVAGPEAEANR